MDMKNLKVDRNLSLFPEKDVKDRTAIACLMRVGSNMVKNIIEDITGHYAGDDLRADIAPSKVLIEWGNIKGKVDDCYVLKTHYPNLHSKQTRLPQNYKISKAIVQVRNPINICPSYFEMLVQRDHKKVADKSLYTENPENWSLCIDACCENFERHCHFWLEQPIPIYILKYETLFENPVKVLSELLTFIKGEPIEGTELQKNLMERLKQKGLASTYLDKPRTEGSKVGYYTKEELKKILNSSPDYIKSYGYEGEFLEALGSSEKTNSSKSTIDIEAQNQSSLKRVVSPDYKPNWIEIPGGHLAPDTIDKNGELNLALNIKI